MSVNKAPKSCPCHTCRAVCSDKSNNPCRRWQEWFTKCWRSIQLDAGLQVEEEEE